MSLQKRILYTIKIDNVVDIITNSSSELFVLEGETDTIVEEMISNIYPNYLREYEELKDIRTMTNREINEFLDWHLGRKSHMWSSNREYTNPKDYVQLPGFEFEEVYDVQKGLKHGEYEVVDNLPEDEKTHDWDSGFTVDSNRKRVIKAIEETTGRFFLYSIDENPDWEYQEKLSDIGTRYHLG